MLPEFSSIFIFSNLHYTPSWTHSTPSWIHSTPSWTHSNLSLTLSSLTSKTLISCSTIYRKAGSQTTVIRRNGRRTARLFNIYHLLPLDATTYKVFFCHCIIELIGSFMTSKFYWLAFWTHSTLSWTHSTPSWTHWSPS